MKNIFSICLFVSIFLIAAIAFASTTTAYTTADKTITFPANFSPFQIDCRGRVCLCPFQRADTRSVPTLLTNQDYSTLEVQLGRTI